MIINPLVNQNIENIQAKPKNSDKVKPEEAAENTQVSEEKLNPQADLLKAYNGIKAPKTVIKPAENTEGRNSSENSDEPKEMTAYEYLTTLPNVKDTFKKELAEVAKVMEKWM